MFGIIVVDHEGLMALTGPGWELGGEEIAGEKPMLPRPEPHCTTGGRHPYECYCDHPNGECACLPF